MKKVKIFGFFFIYFCIHTYVVRGDPCVDNIDIGNDRRSQDYPTNPNRTPLCDYYNIDASEDKWYRFDSHTGGKMTEGCVQPYHCGTHHTLYLQHRGSHPTGDDPVMRTVCVHDGVACCSSSFDIKIKKCVTTERVFYVYKLKRPSGCEMAYCAGNGQPCPAGKIFVEAQNACVDSYPALSGTPTLTGPHSDPTDLSVPFSFNCVVPKPAKHAGAMFRVHWYFDNVKDFELTTDSTSLVVALNETDMVGQAGKYISCGVEAHWKDKNILGPIIFSNSFWIGIQIPLINVIVEEHEEDVSIPLTSTVPITSVSCLANAHINFCIYRFRVDSANDVFTCSVDFKPGNKTGLLHTAIKPTGQLRLNQQTKIQFDVYNGYEYTIWKGYQMEPVPVIMANTDGSAFCSSVTDPHITTFDGLYYHVYEPGNFLLVKSHSSRLFEVHSRLRSCKNKHKVACNCGVAVREGNVVIGVDNCNGPFRTFKKILSHNEENIGQLLADPSGNKMTILMPSGARVVAENSPSWHMNVYVHLPTQDKDKTVGLCGSWDGNRYNDLRLRDSTSMDTLGASSIPHLFSNSYRLKKGSSFFDGYPECENVTIDRINFCTCNGDKVVCEAQSEDDEMFDKGYADVCVSRKKREEDDFLNDFEDMAPVTDFEPLGDIIWPSDSGITEKQAETTCRTLFESLAAFEQCKQMANFDLEIKISDCKQDILISDDLEVAKEVVSVFENACINTAKANVVIGSENETETAGIAKLIQDNVCVNQCSGNGACVEGVCKCTEAYFGADCSIVFGTAPVIKEIENSGMCDLQSNTCSRIKVTAEPMTAGALCKWTTLEAETGASNGTVHVTNSKIINNMKTLCAAPKLNSQAANKYLLSVAVDGQTYSNESLVVIYNSKCMECDTIEECGLKSGTCVLGIQCYDGTVCNACDNAIDIKQPKRSSVYRTQNTDRYFCDSYRVSEGNWYWFNQYTGNQMPEHCISLWHCGTTYPIWLNGNHPTAEKPVVEAMVCGNLDNTSQCCDWNETITIRQCSGNNNEDFFAYQLAAPPFCDMAYCSGSMMPCKDGQEWMPEDKQCIDIDECLSNPCFYGDCLNNDNHYTCNCTAGYTGYICHEEIDECQSSPCLHGTCSNFLNHYTCSCENGYSGINCDINIDECESGPCANEGLCVDGVNIYECACRPGYTGSHCTQGAWNMWQEWSECSETCDHGYKQRSRTCEIIPEELCQGSIQQYDLCLTRDCVIDGDAKENDAFLVIPKDNIKSLITNHDILKQATADSFIEYCNDNREVCCTSMGYNSIGDSVIDITSKDLISLKNKGPAEDNIHMVLSITVEVSVESVIMFCSVKDENIKEGTHYLGVGAVASALTSHKEKIEKDTGLVISEIGGAQKQQQTDQPRNNLPWVIPLALIISGGILAVIAAIIYKSLKKNKPERTASVSSVGTTDSSDQMKRPLSPNSTTDIFIVYGEKPSTPPKQTCYDFSNQRPKSGIRRHNQLDPISDA